MALRFVRTWAEESFNLAKQGLKLLQDNTKNLSRILSSKEKISIPKISALELNFIRDGRNLMQTYPKFLQAYNNIADLDANLQQLDQITEILQPLEQLVASLNDTAILLRSQLYLQILTFYNSAQAGEKKGVEGAREIVDILKPRFDKYSHPDKSGRPKKSPEDPD